MKRILRAMLNYLIFFMLSAFLATCFVSLFAATLMDSLGVTLTSENVNVAAKLTFVNVIALSLLFTLIDALRRKLTVERATRRIAAAARQIAAGDYAVRVQPTGRFLMDDGSINEIADCFNRMAQELSGVEMLRADFISNVSHEMKTPLAAMHNYGTLLQAPQLPDDKRIEYARCVTEGSRWLADMMTNILKLNKLENQQIFPNISRFDLGEQLCEALFFPHPIIGVVLSVAAGVLLAYSFIACEPTDPVSIASYVLSFYALVIVCLRVPGMVGWTQRFRHDNPYYLRYAGDIRLRMSISLDDALVFNAAYAAFQLCLGIRHASVWFYAMAGYYFLLSGMRLMLARHVRRYAPGAKSRWNGESTGCAAYAC